MLAVLFKLIRLYFRGNCKWGGGGFDADGRMGGKLTTRRRISCRNSLHKPEGYHLELCVSGAACGIRPLSPPLSGFVCIPDSALGALRDDA